MITTITAPTLTLLFLATVVCLTTAFVWMFYELQRQGDKRSAGEALDRIRRARNADAERVRRD